MLKTFVQLALRRPELVSEHAQAYAGLFRAEAEEAARQVQTRWAWFAACLAFAAVAAVLAGVSFMLWVVAKESSPQLGSHWIFWVVPAVPSVLSGFSGWKALRSEARVDFPLTREQIALDAQWMGSSKEAST